MALFTSKVDYALRALLDLAAQSGDRPAQSREIAARQHIPESYLHQLLVALRRAGLVRSVRGAAGGYILGREPRMLTAADVVQALHGPDFLGEGPGPENGNGAPSALAIRSLHGRLTDAVREELQRTTLADLVADAQKQEEARWLMFGL
jgi:Rrf2 family cysteine metabolism transcriptional repressor